MNKKNFLRFVILLFVCTMFFHSCRKGAGRPSWDVDVLIPLVKSTLTINNIIPDSLLQHNPDNTLDIVYNSNLSSFSSASIFLIPDTLLDTILWLFPFPLSPCSTIISSVNDKTKYHLGEVELTKVIIRSGKMKIAITNNTNGNIEFNYQISLATLNSQSFNTTFIVPKRIGTTPGVYSAMFDLSGYSFDLRGLSGNSFNTIVKTISAKLPCSEPPLNLLSGDNFKIENSFLGIVPQYAKGYFGHTVSTIGPDSTTFSLFSHIIGGTLNLEDIDINFSIENGIGVDARFTLNNLSSVNTRTGNTVSLSHSIIGNAVNINRAIDNNGNVTSSFYSVFFNPSNSNIKPFVENLPDKISYLLDLEINPRGNESGNNDFIYYDKLINTKLNMTIPLSLIANDLTLADTVAFKMDEKINNVNYGTIYLYAENGFPFSAETQLYLINDNFMIVDSLLSSPNIILAPQLDANFICMGKRLTRLALPVNADKLQLLRDTKKMFIKIKFNTEGKPNHVKIYSFYEMNIKLVGDFNYTVGKKD